MNKTRFSEIQPFEYFRDSLDAGAKVYRKFNRDIAYDCCLMIGVPLPFDPDLEVYRCDRDGRLLR